VTSSAFQHIRSLLRSKKENNQPKEEIARTPARTSTCVDSVIGYDDAAHGALVVIEDDVGSGEKGYLNIIVINLTFNPFL
jgi:hypothetical protein